MRARGDRVPGLVRLLGSLLRRLRARGCRGEGLEMRGRMGAFLRGRGRGLFVGEVGPASSWRLFEEFAYLSKMLYNGFRCNSRRSLCIVVLVIVNALCLCCSQGADSPANGLPMVCSSRVSGRWGEQESLVESHAKVKCAAAPTNPLSRGLEYTAHVSNHPSLHNHFSSTDVLRLLTPYRSIHNIFESSLSIEPRNRALHDATEM